MKLTGRNELDILADASRLLRVPRHQLEVKTHVQTWSDSSCGFPQIARRVISTADTHIVTNKNDDTIALVYHNGRLAYKADNHDPRFQQLIEEKKLPGLNYAQNYDFWQA
jgi:hypothetical protein